MKKFKDLKVGDRVYTASIMDSVLKQDCVGGVIVDYYVSNVSIFSGDNTEHMSLKLQKMRYMYREGYVKDDRPESINDETFIYPNLENSTMVKALVDKHGLLINRMIFSTTKRGVFTELAEIAKNNSEKIKEMENTLRTASSRALSMNFLIKNSMSMTALEPIEEEKPVTEEEFACMAL